MPKKKKKEKGGAATGGAVEDATQPQSISTSVDTPADTVRHRDPGTVTQPAKSVIPSGANVSTPSAVTTKLPSMMARSHVKMMKEGDPNIQLLGSNELAEMEQALQDYQKDDLQGSLGGGMNVFAINKDGISRAVVKFLDRPKPMPLTVSFHFPGTFLTHRYVLAIMKNAVIPIEGADVTQVRYVDRNVRLGTRSLENRWLVTLNDMRAKQLLMMKGIKVVNRTVNVRSYDDVLSEEYREYQRYADIQNRMKMGYGAKNKNAADTPTQDRTDSATSQAPTPTQDDDAPEDDSSDSDSDD